MEATALLTPCFSLEDFIINPPDTMEWVDGQLLEKNGMTLKHSKIQSRLSHYWRVYLDTTQDGGEVYTEVPCRTTSQGRRPDVAYLTPELIKEFGEGSALPQSFPLIAEIISPTDLAEDILIKAQEYLDSGCLEVWLVFPEAHLILVMTSANISRFGRGEIAKTQRILSGFEIEVDQLFV